MAILEGLWDCAQCRKTGISGLLLTCPLCGDPRNLQVDPTEEPYLPENARVITDTSGQEFSDSGATWNCGNCGHLNLGTHTDCVNCDQPRNGDDFVSPTQSYVEGVDADGVALSDREDLEDDRVDAVLQSADVLQVLENEPVKMPHRTLHSDSVRRSSAAPYTHVDESDDVRPTPTIIAGSGDRSGLLRLGAVLVVVVLVLVGLVAGGRSFYVNYIATHTVELTVQNLSWERQVEVEAYRTLLFEDWDVPSDGRTIGSRQEIRSYKQVLDHYKEWDETVYDSKKTGTKEVEYVCGSTTVNKGNGTFEKVDKKCKKNEDVYTKVPRKVHHKDAVYRDDPVYDTKYTYEVDRWVTDRFDSASGTTGPYWPEPHLNGSKQRVGDERRAAYMAKLTDAEARSFDRTTSEASWSRLQIGTVLQGEENRKGMLISVQWP